MGYNSQKFEMSNWDRLEIELHDWRMYDLFANSNKRHDNWKEVNWILTLKWKAKFHLAKTKSCLRTREYTLLYVMISRVVWSISKHEYLITWTVRHLCVKPKMQTEFIEVKVIVKWLIQSVAFRILTTLTVFVTAIKFANHFFPMESVVVYLIICIDFSITRKEVNVGEAG